MLIAVVVVSKMFNDIYYSNTMLAHLGGLSLKELNLLEKEFMGMLQWETYIE